jgi:hypothetical protein
MSNTILQKRSDVAGAVPSPDALAVGEIAVNTADGKAYTKNAAGEIVELTEASVADGGEVFDSDAANYIAAVEFADQQALEIDVCRAINSFIVGCKVDGIWAAIKASCLLAGPRTLSGALTPLAGPAPTNFNFVTDDYNRTSGLRGNGGVKLLDSNRLSNADPQNSFHMSFYVTTLEQAANRRLMGDGQLTGSTSLGTTANSTPFGTRCRNSTLLGAPVVMQIGLMGVSRSSASEYVWRTGDFSGTHTQASQAPPAISSQVFAGRVAAGHLGRASFYSIGESLDLALLSARVSQFMASLSAALS